MDFEELGKVLMIHLDGEGRALSSLGGSFD